MVASHLEDESKLPRRYWFKLGDEVLIELVTIEMGGFGRGCR